MRTCVLNRDRLTLVDHWLEEQRRIWEASTDRLEQFVTRGADDGVEANSEVHSKEQS